MYTGDNESAPTLMHSLIEMVDTMSWSWGGGDIRCTCDILGTW